MKNKILVLVCFITLSSPDLEFCLANRYADSEQRDLRNKNVQLQRTWHEWDYCNNAMPTDSFTPMTEVVPKKVLFLSTYNDCKKMFHTRKVSIAKGKQTIFFPLYFGLKVDYSDDWLLGKCGSNNTEEAEAVREAEARSEIKTLTHSNFTSKLYFKVDGANATPIFIQDTDSCPYHLIGCRDGRTLQEYFKLAKLPPEGDPCDAVGFQPLNGLDAFPMYGWWGKDTRKWKKGEKHTFEFGVPEAYALAPNPPGCFTAKYVITAK